MFARLMETMLSLIGIIVVLGSVIERRHADQKRWYHALLLLGHLESWAPLLEERALEQSLTQFYLYARAELLRIQAAQETQSLLELSMKVCEIRAAWQKRTTSKIARPGTRA